MKSIISLLNTNQLKSLEIKRVRGEKMVNKSDECDLQIRLTHDGRGTECLDFRFYDCEFIRQGALVSVLSAIEGLYLRCTNIVDDSTRRLTFESKDEYSGALKIRITRAACDDFGTLKDFYAGRDFMLIRASETYFAAIEI